MHKVYFIIGFNPFAETPEEQNKRTFLVWIECEKQFQLYSPWFYGALYLKKPPTKEMLDNLKRMIRPDFAIRIEEVYMADEESIKAYLGIRA